MRFKRQALLVVPALAMAAWAAGCAGGHSDAPGDDAAAIPVRVATAAVTETAGTFEAGGVVQARTTAVLTARILAAVREVRVAPGDRVRAGQVLIVLDDRDLGASAEAARAGSSAAGQGTTAAAADERAAQAALVLARTTHDRIAGLHERRSATRQELDQAVAAMRSAEAAAEAAAARVQQSRSELDRARASSSAADAAASFTRVTAPFDGIVTEKMVEVGNMAAPGVPLLRVEDQRGFRLEVRVDEARVGDLSSGARVLVTLDAAPTGPTPIGGDIAEISRALDADTRSFLVKINLPDVPGLRSGMFGRVRFSTTPRQALLVPEEAVVHRGQITSVFVIENGVARLRLVNARGAEVLAGLTAGETVIVSPGPDVADGRRVTAGGR